MRLMRQRLGVACPAANNTLTAHSSGHFGQVALRRCATPLAYPQPKRQLRHQRNSEKQGLLATCDGPPVRIQGTVE